MVNRQLLILFLLVTAMTTFAVSCSGSSDRDKAIAELEKKVEELKSEETSTPAATPEIQAAEDAVVQQTVDNNTTTEQTVVPNRGHGNRTHQIWPQVWSQHGPEVQSWEYKVNCNEDSGSGMECFLADLTSVVVTTPAGEKIELDKDFNINDFSGEVTRRWVRYGPKDGSLPEPGDYTFSYWRGSDLVYEQSVPYDSGVISYPTGVGWKRSGQDLRVWWIPPPEAASGMHYKVLVWPVGPTSDMPISQVFDWNGTSGLLQDIPLLEGTSYRLNVMIAFSDGYAYSDDVFFDWPPLVNTSTTGDTSTPVASKTTRTTSAPNYGSQRAFAVASPWDDLV